MELTDKTPENSQLHKDHENVDILEFFKPNFKHYVDLSQDSCNPPTQALLKNGHVDHLDVDGIFNLLSLRRLSTGIATDEGFNKAAAAKTVG